MITSRKGASARPVRLAVAVLTVLASLSAATVAHAQAWPARTIRIIVPYGTGGASDITTRMAAASLAERLKNPVVVENRPGAGSLIGVQALKPATPDGYTLGLVVSANAAQPWLAKEMPFDVRKDFIPLTAMYIGPLVMTIPVTLPVKTLPEFVTWAKANAGKTFAGSVGAGTTTNLAAELLNQVAGINLVNVSFKSATETHAAVVNGTVQAAFDNFGTPKPLIDAGRVRAIAVSGKQRVAVLPNVPAIHEFYPGFDIVSWTGFALPLATPQPIVDRLTTELRAVMQEAPIRKYVIDVVGGEPGGGSPAELQQRIVTDYEVFGKVIRTAGIKADQ